MIRKTLLAGGIAMALSPFAATAQQGMQIDFSGMGMIAGADLISGIGWRPGDLIIQDMVQNNDGAVDGDIVMGAQAWAPVSVTDPTAGYWTYQFLFDSGEATAFSALGGSAALIVTPSAGEFRLFWNPAPFDLATIGNEAGTDHATGLCHGDLGGDPLCGDQVELFRGDIILAPLENGQFGRMSVTQSIDPFVGEIDDLPSPPNNANISNPTFDDVGSRNLSGSTGSGFIVDITSQNRDYVVNDLVDTNLFLVDATLSVGIGAPYTANQDSLVTERVVGMVADLGFDENWDDVGDSLDGDATIDGPVNDLACNFDDDNGTPLNEDDDPIYLCDVQFETSGFAAFNGLPVSEPTPVLLFGIGLGLMGFLGRRAARKA